MKKLQFSDIVDKEKMIELFKKSGKMLVKFTFHLTANNATHKSLWCDQNSTLLRLLGTIRVAFKLPENEGIFFYVNKKIPDKSKPLRNILETIGSGDMLSIDVATAEMF